MHYWSSLIVICLIWQKKRDKNNKFRFECKKILKEGCKINVTKKLWNGLKTLLKHDKLSLTHNGIMSIISNDNTHVWM